MTEPVGEYPPDWVPHDPPDDLDLLMQAEWADEAFRNTWAAQAITVPTRKRKKKKTHVERG
ncbi:MAG: hypothetical protein NVS3B1_06070 [Marmoricola sp.]